MFKSLLVAATLALLSLPLAATATLAQTAAPDCGTATNVASVKIKIAACIDMNDWNAGEGTGEQEFVYFSKDGNVGFAYITEKAYAPLDAYGEAIIAYAVQQTGGAAGSIVPFEPQEHEINGKTWRSMRYKVNVQGNDLEFLNYYFSDPGFVSAQLVFWTLPSGTAFGTALADKVMPTVTVGG